MTSSPVVYTSREGKNKALRLRFLGGKALNLFKMARFKKVKVPPFFVIPSQLYRAIVQTDGELKVKELISQLKTKKLSKIEKDTQLIRRFFLQAPLSPAWNQTITKQYQKLNGLRNPLVAVRSSATCEDLEEASFAGQQDTYLNIRGEKALLQAVKKCLASLFTVRAVVYRNQQGISHEEAALSIVVQEMVKPRVAGVAFSIDPASGFDRVVRIDASYGLGESIVQGLVSPDTFLVTKDGLILEKELGAKEKMVVYDLKQGTKLVNVGKRLSQQWSLNEATVLRLAETVKQVEAEYQSFVDLEFALDSQGQIWTLQVRPETKWQVIKNKNPNLIPVSRSKLGANVSAKPALTGLGVSPGAAKGRAVFLHDDDSLAKVKPGNILLAKRTDPDMVPAMQVAGAVVTAVGGRTSHAAIVSRELGIPAVVGTEALEQLKKLEGKILTVDGDSGAVYDQEIKLEKDSQDIDTAKLPPTKTRVGLILAEPTQAFRLAKLARNEFEVGLLRAEFVLGRIAVHPQALDEYDSGELKRRSAQVNQQVKEMLLKHGFSKGKEYFIQRLAQGMSSFACAFSGRPVIYRTTDYKTNEYRTQLIGGNLYEAEEENPMLGNRGTVRYLQGKNLKYLGWELEALDRARIKLKGENLELMLPFVRTLSEAELVLAYVKRQVKSPGLKIIAMSEIPANALMAPEFIKLFDGFSIGSNDMTQLVLGTDRDNQALQTTYDEHDPAVVKAILATIFAGLKVGKKVGFCGQGVSDSVIIAGLVSIAGISSASVVPDRYLQTKKLLNQLEKKKIRLKDLGCWLNQQFQQRYRRTKNVKDRLYSQLDWNEVVKSALNLGGLNSFEQAQKLIDKNHG